MKKLRLQMIIGALILLVTGMRAASNITLSTGDTVYDLIQNKSYLISGIDVNASNIDKDFFFYDLDRSGSVRFLAVDGKYKLTTTKKGLLSVIPMNDDGSSAAELNDDGSGSVNILGALRSIDKGGYDASSSDAWEVDNTIYMAQVAPEVYRIALTVGTDLNPDFVNFKFFGEPKSWNKAFTTSGNYPITCNSSVFYIGDSGNADGNIRLSSGQTLTMGDTYVFTLDLSSWTKGKAATLDIQKELVLTSAELDALTDASTIESPFIKVTGAITSTGMNRLTNLRNKFQTLDLSEATLPDNKVNDYMFAEGNSINDNTNLENADIYLRNEDNSWGTSWQFSKLSDNGTTKKYVIYNKAITGKFKITIGSEWKNNQYGNTGDATIGLGTDYTITSNGGDIYCENSKMFFCTRILLTEENGTYTLKLEGKEITKSGIYLSSSMNKWEIQDAWQFYDEGDGVYALYDKDLSGTFKVTDASWTSGKVYGKNSVNATIDANTDYVMELSTGKGNDVSCGENTYNCKKIQLTITKDGEDNDVYTLKLMASVPIANKNITKVLLPAKVTTIGKWAFSACHDLRVVNIPSGVTTISDGAFSYLKNIHHLSVDSKASGNSDKLNIGEYAFQLYKEKTAMPYDENDGLRSFYFGDNIDVNDIGYNSFFQHNQMETMTLGTNTIVEKLSPKVFINCFKLNNESANALIAHVPALYNATFYSCRALTEIHLPASITLLENAAFGDCTGITDIYLESNTSPVAKDYTSTKGNMERIFSAQRDNGDGPTPLMPLNKVLIHFPESQEFDIATSNYRTSYEDNNDYGEFLRLLEKTMDENAVYDCVQQEHATVKLTRTFSEGNWNTIVLPFAMSADQLKETFGNEVVVAEFTGVRTGDDNNVLLFTTVASTLANHPYIIMPSTYQSNNVYTANDVDINKGDITGVTPEGSEFTFTGNYETINNIAEGNDVLYIKGGKFYFRENGNGSTKCKGFRAYFVKNTAEAGARLFSSGESFEIKTIERQEEITEETTEEPTQTEEPEIVDAIGSISGKHTAAAVYDLQGRKVVITEGSTSLPKGIYIVGGRKIAVK